MGVLKQKNHSAPFSGLTTFAKFPLLPSMKTGEKLNLYGILGVPYDLGTTDSPGARLAPRAIRAASTQMVR